MLAQQTNNKQTKTNKRKQTTGHRPRCCQHAGAKPRQAGTNEQTNKNKQTQTNNRSLPAAGAKPTPPGWN
jgi:hypothetical protein